MVDLAVLQQTLGISCNDPSLLEQALVHRSYINENPALAPVSNERLEFLGDAVLGLVITAKLYQDYPQLSEGEMTKLRSALVRRDSLARLARTISLGNHIYMGRGEEASGGRHKPTNLASTLEAVIAAIFLDQGPVTTKDCVLRLFNEELQKVINQGVKSDYKSQLQELIQSRQQPTPTYYLLEAVGPAHDKRFTVEVEVGDTVLGKGSGKSKKTAELQAARSALERLTHHP
ncbi:Ribonuclease 3 [subsurface metagenome]